jgi:CHAT domain-containing protein/tetratricopeptide (TPR) repeat protein
MRPLDFTDDQRSQTVPPGRWGRQFVSLIRLVVILLFALSPITTRLCAQNQPNTVSQAGRKLIAEGDELFEKGSEASLRKALEKFERALPLCRSVNDRAAEAKTLHALGQISNLLGEKQKAIDYFKQALLPARALADRGAEAVIFNDLGVTYAYRGELQEALDSYNQALQLREAVGDRTGELAKVLSNIGEAYRFQGEQPKALEYYNRALGISRAIGDRDGEAVTLNNMGLAYRNLGELEKALNNFRQALRIFGTMPKRAPVIGNIGQVYADLGDSSKALQYFDQARQLYGKILDRHGEAAVLNSIGLVYDDLDEWQKAIAYFTQALRLLHVIGERGSEASTLNNLGKAHFALGEWQKALEYYNQALELHRAVGGRDVESTTLGNMGAVYLALGEKQKAIDHFNQALPLSRAVGDRPGEAITLSNLMYSWKEDNTVLAIFYGKQAVNTLQQLRANISGLHKALQSSFLKSREGAYRLLADLLISRGRLPEAQQVLGLLKEHEYFEFVRRDEAAASLTGVRISFTPAEAELEKRFNEIADRIAEIGARRSGLLALRTLTPTQEKLLSELEAQLETANQVFQKFLNQLEAELKTAKPSSNDVATLREAQVLKDTLRNLDAIALYTIVGQEKYNVILITPDVEKAYEYKISETDLNKKVLTFREALENTKADPLPSAKGLYHIMIGPELARDIAQTGKQIILWSLDGTLRYLPVAALHDGKKYLVESYRNVVITLASHGRLDHSVSPKWQALGLGVSKGEVMTESKPPLIFPPLPGVPEELAGIVRDETRGGEQKGVLPGKVMMDAEFTADAMKTALRLRGNEQPFKLVHIASHFNFEPGDETKSFLLLGQKKTLTVAHLKSMSQIFSGVELLTLSACNTATGGEGEGKEVEGFAVLAQRQGAEAIIATLWKVADPSTSLLMRRFYSLREGRSGMSKAEAMRQAQLGLLRPEVPQENINNPKRLYAHPYFWAPFILIGNWK